ncbi:TPA: hypothetical protein VB850_000722 [Streptococcus suis]|nr:hypothetical protein [Streptococcus suis]
MTNEKLGVLLVDVPELMYFDYNYIMGVEEDGEIKFTVNETDILGKIRLVYPYYSHQRQPWERR